MLLCNYLQASPFASSWLLIPFSGRTHLHGFSLALIGKYEFVPITT